MEGVILVFPFSEDMAFPKYTDDIDILTYRPLT